MKQTSGIDALLEALKQSGVNTGNIGGQGAQSGPAHENPSAGGPSSPFGGGTPFGGSPFGGSQEGGSGSAGGGTQTPHIDLSFLDKLNDFSKKALILLGIVVILALAVAYWWFHPPINIHSVSMISNLKSFHLII